MAKKKEIKIRLAGKDLKIKVLDKKESLEKEIEKQEKDQFEEFMVSGSVTPVLQNGQTAQPTAAEIERAQNPERQDDGRTAGATVNPEFSMYELRRAIIERPEYKPSTARAISL